MTPPNSPTETAAATTGQGIDELAVANASLFIDRLGTECGAPQDLGELTVNGMEAIAADGNGATGAAGRRVLPGARDRTGRGSA